MYVSTRSILFSQAFGLMVIRYSSIFRNVSMVPNSHFTSCTSSRCLSIHYTCKNSSAHHSSSQIRLLYKVLFVSAATVLIYSSLASTSSIEGFICPVRRAEFFLLRNSVCKACYQCRSWDVHLLPPFLPPSAKPNNFLSPLHSPFLQSRIRKKKNMSHPSSYNAPVPGLPYFSPKHAHSPGTPFEPKDSDPTLFKPLTIRGITLKNRIIVAPMCQYSTAESGEQIGSLTPYHIATLGQYALKGAALVFIEASGVQANGRISPNCAGIWSDHQIEGVKAVADFCHAQGALCALQLAHAGRKGSTVAPFVTSKFGKGKISVRADVDAGGWPEDVVGPSGGKEQVWDGKGSSDPAGGFWAPRELTVEEIKQVVKDFASAAIRCIEAGVDVLEIHGAHGVRLTLSPLEKQLTSSSISFINFSVQSPTEERINTEDHSKIEQES